MTLSRVDADLLGKVLGKTLYDSMGRVLLREGTVLNHKYICRLQKRGYRVIYVRDDLVPDLEIKDIIKEKTRAKANAVITSVCGDLVKGKPINVSAITNVVDAITEDLMVHQGLVTDICSLRALDDYTFMHSVNVCVLSLVIRKNMTRRPRDLRNLGMGAILHDIGKLKVPPEILLKPAQLTPIEYERVKKHCIDGYDTLSKYFKDSSVPLVALQHHERMDGSGYCQGLTKDQIHLYGRIVGVADVYDAVTSDRIYRKRMPPHKAMAILRSAAGHQLDEHLVDLLTRCIAHYPVGSVVRLSTGYIGVVILQDSVSTTKPVVRVVVDPSERIMDEGWNVSLSEHPTVSIVEVLEDYPASVKRQLGYIASLHKAYGS